MQCPHCFSSDVEETESGSVCVNCGTVIEDSSIVSAVEFTERAGGASSVVGQFVSSTSSRAFGSGGPGYGFSKESRQVAIDNGKRLIQNLASQLRLTQHYVDSAHRLFILAIQRKFIQGRKTINVVAACLYIVCRLEKSAHLLIDFSDALQTNVFTLGNCFLKFTRLLNLTLPVIDPSLYIHRFAAKMSLGEKTHQVAMTALRLVSGMRRDWIQTGRRPSGICGACLLIAARMHGFTHTRSDVLQVVRVGDMTLRNRLAEFEYSQFSQLTAEEFERLDIATVKETPPPSFIRGRLNDAAWQSQLKLALENTASEDDVSKKVMALSEMPLAVKDVRQLPNWGVKKGTQPTTPTATTAMLALPESPAVRAADSPGSVPGVPNAPAALTALVPTPQRHEAQDAMYESLDQEISSALANLRTVVREGEEEVAAAARVAAAPKAAAAVEMPEAKEQSLVSQALVRRKETEAMDVAQRTQLANTDFKAGSDEDGALSDIEDQDIAGCFLSTNEVEQRKRIWQEVNATYLKEQEERKARGEADVPSRKRKKKRTAQAGAEVVEGDADLKESEEAAAPQPRPKSKKINYEAFDKLSDDDEDGAPAAPFAAKPVARQESAGAMLPPPARLAVGGLASLKALPPAKAAAALGGAAGSKSKAGPAAPPRATSPEEDDDDDEDEDEEEDPRRGRGAAGPVSGVRSLYRSDSIDDADDD